MKLHLDKDAFGVLLEDIHSRTGYRTDVLEKDYYVVLILSELAEMQKDGLPAYFKGGTALYKALKTTNFRRTSTFQLIPGTAAEAKASSGWNGRLKSMCHSREILSKDALIARRLFPYIPTTLQRPMTVMTHCSASVS